MTSDGTNAWAARETAKARYDAAVAQSQEKQRVVKAATADVEYRRAIVKSLEAALKKGSVAESNVRSVRHDLEVAESQLAMAQCAQTMAEADVREAAVEKVRSERELALLLKSGDDARAAVAELDQAYAALMKEGGQQQA